MFLEGKYERQKIYTLKPFGKHLCESNVRRNPFPYQKHPTLHEK